MILLKMRMPLDLLALKPPKRQGHFAEGMLDKGNRQLDRYNRYDDDRRRPKSSQI